MLSCTLMITPLGSISMIGVLPENTATSLLITFVSKHGDYNDFNVSAFTWFPITKLRCGMCAIYVNESVPCLPGSLSHLSSCKSCEVVNQFQFSLI